MSSPSSDYQTLGANAQNRVYPVDFTSLKIIGKRPGLPEYIRGMFKYWNFIWFDAQSRVQSGTRKDKLGAWWLVLTPLINGAMYFAIFGLILGTARGVENFIGFLIIGVFLFQFSSTMITNVAKSVQSNKTMIRAFNFPRITLPIATMVRDLISNIPMFLVMIAIIVLIPIFDSSVAGTSRISWAWWLVIPAIFLMVGFNFGAGLIFARIINSFNDMTNILPFMFRIWFYTSGIFFSLDRFANFWIIKNILELNPLAVLLEIVRSCLLYDSVPALEAWLVLGLWGVVTPLIGFILFWSAEESYGQ